MTATVEYERDPNNPARTAYRVTGPTAESVQDAIDTICGMVDLAFGGVAGTAEFIGPARWHSRWAALGYVTIHTSETLE